MQELSRLWQAAGAGRGRLVWIAGEAGAGKTALVRHFLVHAARGARMLIGACDPLSTPRPLGALLEMVETPGAGFDEIAAESQGQGSLLRMLLGRLRAEAAPTLMVIEDAHWADGATLDLLRYLGRRIEDLRALLLVTYRDDEVGTRHPLRVVIGDLATRPATTRLTLPPLTEAAVRRLAEGSGLDARLLHQRTAGNPFFVTQVLATGGLQIPPTVRDAIAARAARLSPAGQDALGAMAVLGTQVEVEMLGKLTEAVATLVEEGTALGLLEDRGARVAFRHELVRETILEALPERRKRQWHTTILKALEESGTDAEDSAVLAHHAEAAGDAQAVQRHAPAAARRAAALGSHREAAAQLARALRHSRHLPSVDRARLLEQYAEECVLLDRLDEAARANDEALRIRRQQGAAPEEVSGLSRASRILLLRGENEAAEEAAQAALDLAERLGDGRLLALAYQRKAHLRMLDRDPAAASWAERAVDLATRLGEDQIRIAALNTLGSALLVAGDDRGEDHLLASLELASRAGLDERAAAAYSNLGSALGEYYRLDAAERYLADGIALATERDLDGHRHYMEAWQAMLNLHQGRWPDAAAGAQRVPDDAAAIARIAALVVLGRLRARRGDPEVWSALDAALELAQRTGTLQRLAPVRAARAEAAALAGDRGRSASEAGGAYDLAVRRRHPWFTGELAYWLWKAGQVAPAPELSARPYALQIEGAWQEASAAWRDLNCPYEAARAQAEGDDAGGLREALGIFDRLGARPAAAETARRLRQLGERGIRRGPRRTTRTNPAGLTNRELEVLRLICDGHSNAAIAARLALSARTVDHHVSAILAKLDARSRTQAIATAARLGISPQK